MASAGFAAIAAASVAAAVGAAAGGASDDGPAAALVRRALLGVCASCVSDVCSNAIRVVKTKVQTSPDEDTNPLQAARAILEEDGVEGLFFRGLETRLTINCLQGAVFSVAWKYFEKALAG